MTNHWTLFLLGGLAGIMFTYMLKGLDEGLLYLPIGAGIATLACIVYSAWLIRKLRSHTHV